VRVYRWSSLQKGVLQPSMDCLMAQQCLLMGHNRTSAKFGPRWVISVPALTLAVWCFEGKGLS